MRNRAGSLALVSISTLALACGVAQAGVKTFTNNGGTGDGLWSTASNWTGGVLPSAADRAVINAECTVTSSAAADSINVPSGQTLIIAANGSLTLDKSENNVPGDDNSVIAGELHLQAASSLLVISTNDQNFGGAGTIVGQHDQAKIQITDGETFTSSVNLEGQFTVAAESGTVTFINMAQVFANVDGGAITFEHNVLLDDADGKVWQAGDAGNDAIATIVFAQTPAVELDGNFVLQEEGSAFVIGGDASEVDVVISDDGALHLDCGTMIDIYSGDDSLTHPPANFIGTCSTPPGATITVDYSCTC